MTRPGAERPSPSEASGALGRRVRDAFARISIVATVSCVLLLLFLLRLSGSVRQMQHEGAAIRTGLALATAVRAQSIHVAHTVIVGNGSHLDHYGEWVERVQNEVRELRERVVTTERWRVDRIEAISREMDRGPASRGRRKRVLRRVAV